MDASDAAVDADALTVDASAPLVSDVVDVAELQAEYSEHDGFLRKAKQLVERGYNTMRRCRRDGNCFFRAFVFSYLESTHQERTLGGVDRAKETAKANYNALAALYPPMVFEDFHDLLIEALDLCVGDDFGAVTTFLHDPSISDCLVSLFRFVTAAEIIGNEELYMPFLPLGHTTQSFTQNEVLNMGRESEEIHLVALSKRMSVNLRVIYIDARSADATVHDFFHNETKPKPDITILYRPGHYDILYGTI